MTATNTHRPTGRHPVFARVWPRLADQLDRQGADEHRRRLLEGLHGRVVEIGAGDGRSFAYYPDIVDEVIAVEPESSLRQRAHRAASHAPVPVTILDGIGEALPVPDAAFDATVVSLLLCSVPDPQPVLAEARRTLRPGGQLRFFEHVAADGRAHRRLQHALDATIWPRIAGGCHTARDTTTAIHRAGFALETVERFRFPPGPMPTPTSPHVLGRAHAA